MKLYRGLKSSHFVERNKEVEQKFNEGWRQVLSLREQGDLSYPEHLNKVIIELFRLQGYTRQYFTDDRSIALAYAKAEHGVLVEIDVSVDDILEHFIIEFQNYSKRRQSFEVTYIVRGADLAKYTKRWKLNAQQV
jgi:hypothetical protein